MRKSLNRAPLIFLLLVLWVGCKKEETQTAPEPAKPAQATPASKPASPVQGTLSSATGSVGDIDFRKKRDPFKPLISSAPAPAPAGQSGAPNGGALPAADQLPIQSFEVNKFKVAGIIAGLKENRALVIDPTGKGYVVQAGMQIGNANGRISRITANSVEVVERYKEGGRTKSRTIVLTLAKKR